ncbi:hypothetical protein EJB05_05636 [Eragrostis curvula]|uniref:TF-B3 domain-containing protein n=1 Tax=Eragrostis curvula TaxID=38414 RepID=A0A5J9WD60_9POAL|nr:hypothetical protein EJB05_05636 [Eragrostis curvula]
MNKNRETYEERGGFYFWGDIDDQDKHFFKIMAGDFRKRLTIPQKFVQHFLGTLTGTIKLESRNGATFDVQVIYDLGKLVLGSGWDEFVSVHDLNMGDFLVFKYDGSSHLKVLIFDPSGCEKPPSVVMEKVTHISKRNEPVGMASPSNDLSMKSSSNERKRSWAQWDSSKQGNNIIHIGSSSSPPDPSEGATLSEDDQSEHCVPRYIVPFGTCLGSMMKKKLKQKLRAIHSEIPIHVCVIKKSNIYGTARCMGVKLTNVTNVVYMSEELSFVDASGNLSRGYADAYLPFEEKVLLLQCNGKNWKVRCVKVGKRSMQNLGKNCSVCMEWQEHCYWSHMADEEKHFFKIMAGDFAQSISIPTRFANNFNGHIAEVVTLKSPSGKIWSIGVGGDTDEVVFRSGWKDFVSAHSIEEGDYLVFKYAGVSSFDVLILDSSGCEKTSPHFANNHGYERIEAPARVEGVRHGCHGFNKGKTCMPQSPPSDDDDDGNAQLEVTFHKNTGRNIPKASKRNLSDVIEQAQCEVKDGEDDPELDEDAAPAKTGYYFCKNGPVIEYHLTLEEKEEISSIRVPVQPRNPVFVQVMHPGHVRGKKRGIVAVSSEFATKFMGTLRREIILQRASSRGTWHVSYNCNKFSRGLCGRGWCSFVEDNGLLEHDVCLFEVMQGARRPTMTVHILRKVRGRFVLLR